MRYIKSWGREVVERKVRGEYWRFQRIREEDKGKGNNRMEEVGEEWRKRVREIGRWRQKF